MPAGEGVSGTRLEHFRGAGMSTHYRYGCFRKSARLKTLRADRTAGEGELTPFAHAFSEQDKVIPSPLAAVGFRSARKAR